MRIDANQELANWHEQVAAAVAAVTGKPFVIREQLSQWGGSINRSLRLVGENGEVYFLKLNTPAKADVFAAEQTGLEALQQAGCVRVPQVIAHGVARDAAWLLLEFLPLNELDKQTAALLGEQLAAQHQCSAERFGFAVDNVIGATPQSNDWQASWIEFWREQRLAFQLQLAARNGAAKNMLRDGERLQADLGVFFATYQPAPSLLHGDLWSGNAAACNGMPVIFDPAVYYGDRETDLAMTELFGGFPPAFYTAYRAAWPLDEGYTVRRSLYNVYHVLNHYNLFGGSYAAQAHNLIQRLLAEIR